MKRYSVSYLREVNEHASKTGFAFHYSERTDDINETIERYKNNKSAFGIRITDSQTKKVVFEDIRPIKGILTITRNGVCGGTYKKHFLDLSEMREREHHYTYNCDYITKVEREIVAP